MKGNKFTLFTVIQKVFRILYKDNENNLRNVSDESRRGLRNGGHVITSLHRKSELRIPREEEERTCFHGPGEGL